MFLIRRYFHTFLYCNYQCHLHILVIIYITYLLWLFEYVIFVISVNVCHVYVKDHNGNKCVHFLCYPNI